MNIVIHTQYYPPEIGAPQARLHDLATGLTKRGAQVTVLTAMPNYPRGRIYEGYTGWLQIESLDGVRIIRTAIYPSQSAGMLPRLLSYFSFLISSLLIGGFKIGQADFLLTESPPLFLGVAGFLLSRWKRARWIFNVSDLWPESVVELGIMSRESVAYKFSSALEKFLYHEAWLISCQSRSILKNIRDRFPDLRLHHLPNGVDTNFFQPDGEKPENESFHIVYAGLHGLAQGLEQVIYAAQKLPDTERIEITFVGDGPEKNKLIQLTKDLGLNNIHFREPVAKEKVPSVLKTADALLVPLKVQLTGAVPSKLYEAMAMGKPVILVAQSEAAKIVNDANCGVVVTPGDIDILLTAIIYLKNNPEVCKQMGENGRRAAVLNHDRARIVDDFARLLFDEQGYL